MIHSGLGFLARHATSFMAAGVFLGLAWPGLARELSPLLVPTVFALLVAALLRQDPRSVLKELDRPLGAIVLLLWLTIGTPLLVLAASTWLPLPAGLAAALVLMASSAPLISSIAFALLLGLDAALATVVALASTLLLPIYLPPLALGLLGIELTLSTGAFMLRLGALVGGAVVVTMVIRRIVSPIRLAKAAPSIDGLNVIFLLLFAVAIMDGVTATAIKEPAKVLIYTAAAFLANVGLQATGTLVFLWLGRARALTCGLLSGNRNMAILLAAMAGGADFDVMLFFAVGQLPIYILPALLRPVYRRYAEG